MLVQAAEQAASDRVDPVASGGDEHAELVAAEPVGVAGGRDRLASRAASRTSSPSPAGWPKASLYSLKPSRSNSSSARGSPGWRARAAVEVRHQAAAVAEAGERVGTASVCARTASLVLEEGERHPRQCKQQRPRREAHARRFTCSKWS